MRTLRDNDFIFPLNKINKSNYSGTVEEQCVNYAQITPNYASKFSAFFIYLILSYFYLVFCTNYYGLLQTVPEF